MSPNPRAVQELDLLLQEGRADNPALLEGLVHLYAGELFHFAWTLYRSSPAHPTVHRLQARRTVTYTLTTALQHLRQFQEQPSTFFWLLRLTYAHAAAQAPVQALAIAYLRALSPEDLAYILNIPEQEAVSILDAAPEHPPSRTEQSGSAVPPAAFTPLTPAESTALLDSLRGQTPTSRGISLPRHTGEFAMIGMAIILFTLFVRATPNRTVYLPTPLPTSTATPLPPSAWDAPPLSVPITVTEPLNDAYYQPPNPYEVWMPTRILHTGSNYIISLTTSPTEPLLVIGDNRNHITLWDLITFTTTQTLSGPTGGIHSLTFSKDGTQLATGGGDGSVYIWEIPGGTLLQVFTGHPNIINDLAFSPDGQTLAVAAGNELTFWQVNSGAKLSTYGPFQATLTGVAYSPDGNRLTLSAADGKGWVIRTEDVYPLGALALTDYGLLNDRLLFSPDGRFLIAIPADNLPTILSIRETNPSLQVDLVRYLIGFPDNGYRSAMEDFIFSPDGSLAAAAIEGGSIHFWDPKTWTPIQTSIESYDYQGSNHKMAFSFDARLLVVTQKDGDLGIMELVDRTAVVEALVQPKLFQRMDSDRQTWTYTMPGEEQLVYGDTSLLNLENISEEAGFSIKIPLLGVLNGDHTYNSISYEPASGIVYVNAWAQNDPGLLWGFNLQEYKAEPGKWKTSEIYPFNNMDRIGLTAAVEPVQIGNVYGEFVDGQWMYMDEDNPDLHFNSLSPGDEIHLVTRWSSEPSSITLRWMDEDIVYTLQAYTYNNTLGPVVTSDTLILLAQTMFSPMELSLPWNARLIQYTVSAGDTCSSLAGRFYISEETVRRLNHLTESCLLSRGQPLLLPAPAEPYLTTDLNCDSQEETLLLLHDAPDPEVITGIALDTFRANVRERAWELSASEMDVDFFSPPELFTIEGCDQLVAITGGTPTDGRTRIFRWNGLNAEMLLNAPGHPYSSDGTIATLPQNPDGPFVIPLIQYVPATLPSLGPCPNEVAEATWNGFRFSLGGTKIVSGECAGN